MEGGVEEVSKTWGDRLNAWMKRLRAWVEVLNVLAKAWVMAVGGRDRWFRQAVDGNGEQWWRDGRHTLVGRKVCGLWLKEWGDYLLFEWYQGIE